MPASPLGRILRRCRSLGAADGLAAASLALEALPDFYWSVPLDEAALLLRIREEFAADFTELGDAMAMLDRRRVDGMFAAYPAGERMERQQTSVRHMLDVLDEEEQDSFLSALAGRAAGIGPMPEDSYYLARFAVIQELRGTGFADRLLAAFMHAGRRYACYTLHVRADNHRAIAFYRKYGFAIWGNSDADFLTMAMRP
jgi:ribosomal protein S18 acetylase RimI-like enzyme